MERTRRVLIASYYFPPDAAVGGLRMSKFARSLPEFGWEAYVLTVVDKYRDQGLDAGRLKGLEHVTVVRTPGLPTVRGAYLSLKGLFDRLTGRRAPGDRPPPAAQPSQQPNPSETLAQRIKRCFISLVVMLPDTEKNWSVYAAFSAVRLIRRHRIDCVMTSGPPFSAHLIGLVARLFTKARWIADFRDPWGEMLPARFPETQTRASDAVETWMEWSVMTYADKVVTTTDRLRESLVARYPHLPAGKFVWISNSIDTEKFRATERIDKYEPLTITYAGTLYFDRTPEPLFRAVGDLLAAQRIRSSDIRIKLVGHCRNIEGVDTQVVAARYGVEEVVEVLDPVPYADAIRIMQRSHLLLVIAPERHRLVVGAKLFDYLGSGSKILAIAEDGASSDLIDDTASGRCFSSGDSTALREYLCELITSRSFAGLQNDVSAFARYDVRHLTARLAAELQAADVEPVRAVASWSR